VAYITRERWFFGRPFVVDPRVLVPRPATEALVDLALRTLDAPHPLTERVDGDVVVLSRLRSFSPVRDVVDLGTGSGCVAITLAAERADLSVLAVDVSVAALDVAAVNVERLGVAHRVRLQASDGLRSVAPLLLRPFLFVSNPPYIPDDHALARDVHAFEPPLALRGGPGHGAALLLRLVAEAWAHPRCVGVVLECRADQVPFLDAQLQAS
jgi:release factor glutamine methyltransferase